MFEKSIQSIINAFTQQRKSVKTKITVSSSHRHETVSLTSPVRWHSSLEDWARMSSSGLASDRISRHRASKSPVPIMTCTYLSRLADGTYSRDSEISRSRTERFCSTWIALSRYGSHVPRTASNVFCGSTKIIQSTSVREPSGQKV